MGIDSVLALIPAISYFWNGLGCFGQKRWRDMSLACKASSIKIACGLLLLDVAFQTRRERSKCHGTTRAVAQVFVHGDPYIQIDRELCF